MPAADITVGLLHPGSMGAAFGAQLRTKGTTVLWCPAGRSDATRNRAEAAGIEPVALPELLDRSDTVLALCPPAAAEETAAEVHAYGFADRTYIEANAIAPERMRRIAELLAGAHVVDAAVIGSPPVGGKKPVLYLSGSEVHTQRAARLFDGTDIGARDLEREIGAASALKLAYSSYQKASRVLAALAYAAARTHGVGEELVSIAAKRAGSYLTETDYIPKTASRAWRWGPELADAGDLLRDAGLPDDLMRAAARTLEHWDAARDSSLSVEEALALLTSDPRQS